MSRSPATAKALDLVESALLAGLIRGPNLYSPSRRPDVARGRRDLVLRLMAERQVITESDRPARAHSERFLNVVRVTEDGRRLYAGGGFGLLYELEL